MKGLSASVYRNSEFPDATNRGPSSRYNQVLVVDPEVPGPADFHPERHFPVKLVRRNIGDRVYIHAEPLYCEEWPDDHRKDRWHSFGGNFIFTSDSRLREVCPYPIPLHDRVED